MRDIKMGYDMCIEYCEFSRRPPLVKVLKGRFWDVRLREYALRLERGRNFVNVPLTLDRSMKMLLDTNDLLEKPERMLDDVTEKLRSMCNFR